MIKRKICDEDGCENPRWARGKCKFHDKGKPNKPKNKFISPISNKELKRLAKYRPIRDKFLKENPTCMVSGCDGKSTVHHAMGRIGDLLWDIKYFRNLCWEHHKYVEEHPEWAKENGYSINRLNLDKCQK